MGKKSSKPEKKEEFPKSLRILCILSMIGFAAAMAMDAIGYLSFSSVEDLKNAVDQTGWEQMEDRLEVLSAAGVDISEAGLIRISDMYFYRAIIDILALLGVTMMFSRLKMGYTIYVIFQLAYVALPVAMFGSSGTSIVGMGSIAITLVYVGLFTTQKRYLNR